jgi:GNAT superfamily N-acetyltransferase
MTSFSIRRATAADVRLIARHRAEMFSDMGSLPRSLYDRLVADTVVYLEEAIPKEEYIGWLAAPASRPEEIVAGAGVQVRRTLPHPIDAGGSARLVHGRQGIVINVYTEKRWRARGAARCLMDAVMTWAHASGLETLVLHASKDGHHLYETLGFVQTNEMRYQGLLGRDKR